MRIEIPQLKTNDDNINKAFRIAYSDIIASIWKHKDGLLKEEKDVILAGLGYDKPWTRDAAINVWNCGGILFPEASKNTLLSVLSEDEYGVRVGGEYWDAIIWVTGAWYYYLYTGDVEFLELAYKTSKTTLKYFEDTEFNEELNLFRGPACYGDGVAAYPDIYAEGGDSGIRHFVGIHPELCAEKGVGIPMHCLSTNCLYYNAYVLADKMAEVLGKEKCFEDKAENLKEAINKHFWLFDKGYYRYIVDDFGNCDYQEGMGQSFAILFGVADKEQVKKILENQHLTDEGIACVYPSFKRYTDFAKGHFGRHSGVIWPHIESFWADAAAHSGRYDLFEKEFNLMTKRAVRDGHFAEVYHPVTGEIYGGIQERSGNGIVLWDSEMKQTWSATGYIRLIFMNILGMNFTTEGISFKPYLPEGMDYIELKNVKYRDVIFNVAVRRNENTADVYVNSKKTNFLNFI